MEFTKQIGASIVFELKLEDNGIAITGETPMVAFRRISDGYYLDFNDNTFKASGWTTKNETLVEATGDVQLAGVYQLTWDSSLATALIDQGVYAAHYTWVDGSDTYTTIDVVRMVNSDLAEMILANRLAIDETLSKLTIYEADGVTVKREWALTNKDGSAIVLDGTAPVNRGA